MAAPGDCPSEQDLWDRIRALDDGTFHRLGEIIAEREHPHRFNRVIPQGRTLLGRPIRGVDAYAPGQRGRHIMEATSRSELRSMWRHLQSVIDAILRAEPGTTESLLYIALADADQDEARTRFGANLERHGVESFVCVFRKELIRLLTHPRYADVWSNMLDLPAGAEPFRLVRQAAVYGDETGTVVRPSLLEFLNGHVYEPPESGIVLQRLEQEGWARLAGRGAVGKTTVALAIALRRDGEAGPVYYLDLKSDVQSLRLERSLDALTTRSAQGVMFVVDNVHLEAEITIDLFRRWQARDDGSRLLLVGRSSTEPPFGTSAATLNSVAPVTTTLVPDVAAILGCYSRLARRLASGPIPTPQPQVGQAWLETFGGDLIAFSLALTGALSRIGPIGLARHGWEVAPTDAMEYVRTEYFSRLSKEELDDLLRVAAWASVDLDIPAAVLKSGIPECERRGIILRTADFGYHYFSLPHPSLGDILLRTAERTPINIVLETAGRTPGPTAIVAARLSRQGDIAPLRDILKQTLETDPSRVLSSPTLLSSDVNGVRGVISALATLGFDAEIVAALDAVSEEFLDLLATSPLKSSVSFLQYIDTNWPLSGRALREGLQTPPYLSGLLESLVRMPLTFYKSVLPYTAKALPSAYDAMLPVLRSEAGQLAVLSELSDRGNLTGVRSAIEWTRLGKGRAASFRNVLLGRQLYDDWLGAIERAAGRSEVGELIGYMRLLDSRSPESSPSFRAMLLENRNLESLISRVYSAPLDAVTSLLRTDDLGPAIASRMSKDHWIAARADRPHESAQAMSAFASNAHRLLRDDLAYATARGIIQRRHPVNWSTSDNVNLGAFITVLQWNLDGPDVATSFVRNVATDLWLKGAVAKASAGRLASALYRAWCLDLEAVDDVMTRDIVWRSIRETVRSADRLDVDQGPLLSLYGSAWLYSSTRIAPVAPKWGCVVDGSLSGILATSLEKSGDTLNTVTVLITLGVRRLAAESPNTLIELTPEVGRRLIQVFEEADPLGDGARRLNADISKWLEHCSDTAWNLVAAPLDDLTQRPALRHPDR